MNSIDSRKMASLLDSSSDSDEEVILKNVSKREIQLSTGNSQPRNEFEKIASEHFIDEFFELTIGKPKLAKIHEVFIRTPKK